MDEKIANLKSTTFCGRRFRRQQIAEIKTIVNNFPALSHRELAHTICEYLQWTTPTGTHKIQTCLNALEKMELLGIIKLPAKIAQRKKAMQKKIQWTEQTNEASVIDTSLNNLMPILLKIVTEKEDIMQWNEFVDRYHYLGYRRPIGSHLRYYIIDRHGRKLGCILFSFATTTLICRDEWIGWSKQNKEKHLNLVINNNRFLIFPWVKVNHLASKCLSSVARQIDEDWENHHGYRPVLLETFVDSAKYNGTCYKAANWQCIGKSAGTKSAKPVNSTGQKDVYIYPLCLEEDMRAALMDKKHSPSKKSQPFKNANIATDSQVFLWQKIITVVSEVAENFDPTWQKRQRVISTLLIILFIFRLVFSKNKQGYGSTIAELWEYCHKLNIKLPQTKPITPSSLCVARKKMDESVFKTLNAAIIHAYEVQREDHPWHNHRIFAVDGSKINLPKELLKDSYKVPSENAYYPQGLMSCLYQLKSEIPFDFTLAAHRNERKLALEHLSVLSKDDVVIYDRGYFSYAMLYAHYNKGIYAVFRLQNCSFKIIDEFIASTAIDEIVTIYPSLKDTQNKILKNHPTIKFIPLQLRLIKYTIEDVIYIIGTTLLDCQRYNSNEFKDVYHSRWGIEELYKVSKVLIDVEDFHAKTERGVKQELFAHFVIITLSKIFANQTNDVLFLNNRFDKKQTTKVNLKNCLLTIARNLEGLFLEQATRIKTVITTIFNSIATCYQKQRINRSYERVSHKVEKKWRPSKRTVHAAEA